LLIGAAAGAGLAVGWAVWPRSAAPVAAPAGERALGPHIRIGVDGRVIVVVAQAEMGQGIWSALAQIVADELGADWRAVAVEPAPIGADYAHPGLALDAAAGLYEPWRGLVLGAGRQVARLLDFQITGGSTSVRAWESPLRAAAATARALLCAAAARQWGVDPAACDTAAGFVVHKANRLAFHALADRVDPDDAPDQPVLRRAGALAGRPLLRLDVPAKVDGSARFGIDVRMPGLAYAAIAQGPIGAVRAPFKAPPLPAGVQLVEQPGFVACVAPSWFAAQAALDALPLRWSLVAGMPGPALQRDVAALLSPGGRPFAPGADIGKTVHRDGDLAARLAAGPIVTADYALPHLAHACLEPMTATARVADGRAEVWAPTQSASLARRAVAAALGLDADDVVVHPTMIGGGFGRKVEGDACAQAALIARAAGRPVQLIWSRAEDFGRDMFRPAVAARLHGRAGPRGITAWDCAIAAPDVGAQFAARNIGSWAGRPAAGAGASFTGFIVESFVDELAASAGADPGAFRLAMLANRPRHAAVLRAVLAMAGPPGRVPGGKAGETLGRGMALVESFGSIVAQVAEVAVAGDGGLRVTRIWAAVDCGRVINPDTVEAQIEGGIVYGLSAALFGRITFSGGRVEQDSFSAYPLITMADCPAIFVQLLPSAADPGGVGEPGTPPVAPAVANALFAATGRRWRRLPFLAGADAGGGAVTGVAA
jgi:isoquinoline 1-oxidoreductase beta subunit